MNPLRLGTLVLLVGAAVLLPGAAHSAARDNVLVGVVGTGGAYVITLKDDTGDRVTKLDPGTYTVRIHDDSTIHNFHLSGPGVDQATTEDFVGDVVWTVTFVDGKYGYECDPHSSIMHGSFVVGTVAPPPAPIALSATVGPRRTISLRNADGTRVSSLTAGRYRITVRDRSKTDNFHLRGPGLSKSTGIGFRGTVRWTLSLGIGSYSYRSDKHKSLRGSFGVTPAG